MVILTYKRGKPFHLKARYLTKEYEFTEENGYSCEVADADADVLIKRNPLMFDIGPGSDRSEVEYLDLDDEDGSGDDPNLCDTFEEAVAVVNAMGRHAPLDAYANEIGMKAFEDGLTVAQKKEAIIEHMEAMQADAGSKIGE